MTRTPLISNLTLVYYHAQPSKKGARYRSRFPKEHDTVRDSPLLASLHFTPITPAACLRGAVLLGLHGLGALADERLVDVGDHTACVVPRGLC